MKFSSLPWLWSALLLTIVAAQNTNCPTSPQPVQSPDSQYLCNAQGELSSPGGYYKFNSTSGSYTNCYSSCVSDGRCQAFSYDRKTNFCNTFLQPFKRHNFKQSRSGVVYWDLNGCFHIPNTCRAFNLLADGSFEGEFDHAWEGGDNLQICSHKEGLAEDGNCIYQLTVPDENTGDKYPQTSLAQSLSITNGTQYTSTFYYRVDSISISGADTCELLSGFGTGFAGVTVLKKVQISSVTDGWVQSDPVLYTPHQSQVQLAFLLNCTTIASKVTLSIDNASLIKTQQ